NGTITNSYATGSVTGQYHFGGLCGYNSYGTITNCYATGAVTGGNNSWYLGGLCGYNSDGTITNCYSTGSVAGGDYSRYLGGLCGDNSYGTITNCYATGLVTGDGWLGGLCGDNSYGTITNCYATGSVTGEYHFGGLCGENYGTITNCYATGLVTGYAYLGGLCGENYGTITNCYAAGSVTGDVYLGGLCGGNYSGTITNCYFYLLSGPDNSLGTALDDLQMQDAVSFAGFDFAGNPNDGQDGYWTIVNGHCPKLTWQTDDGPLVSPPVTTLSGSGYSYNPFQINSYADFTEFRTNSRLRCGYYILATDIDLSGETFTTAVIGFFGGHFNGNGHVISNITIDTAGANNNYLGLFSSICASVSDLSIENINITGGYKTLCLGGLCGYNANGTITNCYSTGSVTGWGDSRYLGGLCGYNSHGIITDCYAAGSIIGGSCCGGLCGYNARGTIINCYATGSIIGGSWCGGLCGYNYNGTITNCFWDVETSGMNVSDGGTGKTTDEMQIRSTFTDAGWDFVGEDVNGTDDFWRMCVDGIDYPKLSWQFLASDFVCRDGVDLIDFAVLAETWGLSSGQAGYNELCDLVDDDTIDLDDLAVFVENWLAGK
ncbi:MAG: hypothetical protein KAJ46_07040, partial [Sedimentisphaerales bacterium]|nr:hypothetical protein [Sedimentisphaerales bacterium]